jgi:Flp pilus assembly protein TadB
MIGPVTGQSSQPRSKWSGEWEDGRMRRAHLDQPLVITTAPESSDDEYDRRRKKYAIMMAIRAGCVIAAGTTYRFSVVLALAFVVGGMFLPWCAVLIANDRPARKKNAEVGFIAPSVERGLPSGDDRTVDG